jgi:citrate synthase
LDRPPIATSEGDEIVVRGVHLARDAIGRLTFTELFLLDLDGQRPIPHRVRVVDAILVALMEHGITPSTLAARLVLDGAPEATQGAVAAGLLATGSRFLGTIEQVAELLQSIVSESDTAAAAASRVATILAAGGRVPGLGHNLHERVDPRVEALQRVAAEEEYLGSHSAALSVLQQVAAERVGRPLIVNAAGAIGAILSDLGYPPARVRGFALVARAAGLVAHVADEQERPIAREVWVEAHRRAEERSAEEGDGAATD